MINLGTTGGGMEQCCILQPTDRVTRRLVNDAVFKLRGINVVGGNFAATATTGNVT